MAKISRKELADKVADELQLSKGTTRDTVKKTFELIRNLIGKGDDVAIQDFGTFVHKMSAARKGRNPQTGASLDIPASATCKFKVSKVFKTSLN